MSLARRFEPERLRDRLRNGTGRWRDLFDPLSFVVVFVLVWQFGVEHFDVATIILPTPLEIYDSIVFNHAIMLQETIPTVQFIIYGFVVGSVIGIVSAVGVTYSRFLERAMYPIMIIAFVVPKIVIAPVLVFFTGPGYVYYTAIPLLLVFFPMLENTAAGLKGMDKEMSDLARLYGASGWFTFRKVQVPYTIPFIMAGLKIGITQSTIGVIIAEFIAPEQGLGQVIMIGMNVGNTTLVFAGIIFVGIAGIVLYEVIVLLERWFVFWGQDVEGTH